MINNYTLRINWEYARNIDFLTFRFHETNIINPMQNTSWKEYYGFYTIKKCFKNFYIKKKNREREDGRFSQSVIWRTFGIINIYFPALRRLDKKKNISSTKNKIKWKEKV
jgi:hypothetical protein